MADVVALTFAESAVVAVALVLYAAVAWMIAEIVMRPDFSPWTKVLWSVVALVFSVATLIVYVFWVRKKDYSTQ